MISTKETAVNNAITTTNDQSAEVGAQLEALTLAEPDEGETEADQASATKQVAREKKALDESRMLFEELLSVIQTAAAMPEQTREPQSPLETIIVASKWELTAALSLLRLAEGARFCIFVPLACSAVH